MLLWADPPIKSYLSTLHGAKQLQTDQLLMKEEELEAVAQD